MLRPGDTFYEQACVPANKLHLVIGCSTKLLSDNEAWLQMECLTVCTKKKKDLSFLLLPFPFFTLNVLQPCSITTAGTQATHSSSGKKISPSVETPKTIKTTSL